MRRFLTFFTLIVCMILVFRFPVQATGSEEADIEHSWWFTQTDRIRGYSDNRTEPSHPDATLLGIDVSHHQGEIDWDAVATSDVDFVILRCGYGMDQRDQDDRQFLNNALACERLGIPYGVYLYSYATNTKRAQSEAEHMLRLINGRALSYPVFYDLEDSTAVECDLPAIAKVFCDQIQAAGYPVGIYSSTYWWNHYLTDPCFDQWYRWVAQYYTSCTYEGNYQIWQFSSKGSVPGISGNVDLNYQIGSPSDHGTKTYYHSYTAEVTTPTCTQPGYTLFTCTDCSNRYTAYRTDPLAHSWDEGQVITPSTCSVAGSIFHTCKDCSTTEIAPLPLEWHSYSGGICTNCGAEFPLRISGDDRYATSIAVADQLKAYLGVDKFQAVIIASGREFPDALAGSYLANQKQAPILLVNNKDTHSFETVKQYIVENMVPHGTVYILGGNAAVPAKLESILGECNIQRLAGANRYETNLKILEEAGTEGQEILICSGKGFADSLSASAVNKPILLLNNQAITEAQRRFLENSSGTFRIIGGESAISPEMEAELRNLGTVERISGNNRYETSIAVAEYFFTDPNPLVLAYGRKFPDGLCGGPLACALNSPLILTGASADPTVATYIAKQTDTSAVVLGGEGLIPDDTVSNLFSVMLPENNKP